MNKKKTVKIIIELICYLWLILAIYVAEITLVSWILIDGYTQILTYPLLNLFLLTVPIVTIILIRLRFNDTSKNSFYIVAALGTSLTFIFFLPLMSCPFVEYDTEKQFNLYFGFEYMDDIDSKVKQHFLKHPYSLSAFYFGVPRSNCIIEEDITYITVSRPDSNIRDEFKFDSYLPADPDSVPDDPYPVVIFIHGGGWRQGDKGQSRMLAQRLASQGYAVFDIQYGLWPQGYNIEDMVKQIGKFTYYLEDHKNKYKADLSKVFIAGGSAGGHLSLVVGLGYKKDYFNNTFASSMTVRGIFPSYAPVDIEESYNKIQKFPKSIRDRFNLEFIFDGTPDSNPKFYKYYSPINLVSNSSAPVLFLQGCVDALVPESSIDPFIEEMQSKGRIIITIKPTFGGHGFDWNMIEPSTQVCVYYIERFLGILREKD